ncbi:conserved hypothetical protein [Histoplasma capsulatum H143]|uniref:Uncharacterized protein n=1 Tax=Ajellomyces capsulatus (strain H143) TaxID=544712 RepID=C6H225_AJECH|nr:conserved hypothetical protein [Histoplasma capsulatum H143]
MSVSSSQWPDLRPSSTSPPPYQQGLEIASRIPDAEVLEDEGGTISGQYSPETEVSDDGTYYTNDGKLSDSDSNVDEHEENQQSGREDDYDLSRDSLAPERPNRYPGPPSTWCAKTRQERHEINSLEARRARDLSIHLFNAFALKRRAMRIKSQNSELDPEPQSKSEEDKTSQFVPTKQWTAWPLPTDEVPRGDVHVPRDDSDIWNISGPSDERPSAELEECLIAQMLKTSKERFESRSWEKQQPRVRNRHTKTAPGTETGGSISTGVDESDKDIAIKPDIQFRPVVQADDDKSRSMLRPTARHILSDLDNILMSLHHARQAYVSTVDLSHSEHETEHEDDLTSRSVSRSRVISRRGRSGSRGIKRSRNAPMNTDPPVTSDHGGDIELPDVSSSKSRVKNPQRTRSITPRRSRSRSPGSRQSKLGLRDWSDIVGIASISGWPTSVVMRTAKRCSELFGEDMAFNILTEGKLELNERDKKRLPTWEYVEKEGLGESSTDDEIPGSSSIAQKRRRVGEIYCPVKECSRSTKGFSRTWNLNQHIKNRHPNLELRGRQSKSTPLTEESG